MTDDILAVYLRNHMSAARGGLDAFRRVASHHEGSPEGEVLQRLTREIQTDLNTLQQIMADAEVSEDVLGSAVTKIGERVGRLKPNGSLFRQSALTPVMELEMLRDAVSAKAAGWDALLEASASDNRLTTEQLLRLRTRAQAQFDELVDLHRKAAATAFAVAQAHRSGDAAGHG